MRPGKLILFFWLALLPFCATAKAPVTYTSAPLTFETGDGPLHFTMEEALSDAQHENGLMFRTSILDKHGMIFVFNPSQKVNFWMKNTLISLDMLFVSNNGRITQIVENATPESTDLIPSIYDTRAVIELRGGEAAHYHIRRGDRVIYSAFP